MSYKLGYNSSATGVEWVASAWGKASIVPPYGKLAIFYWLFSGLNINLSENIPCDDIIYSDH